MNYYNLSFTFILFLIILNEGCNIIESEGVSSDFESGYYYTTTKGNITLYRSKLIIAVEFESSVTAEEAKGIIHTYNLEPIKMFENTAYGDDWEKLIEDGIVLMKLPNGAKLEDYLSSFPKATNQKFGDIQEIKFCLPTFAFDSEGDPRSRFIINDEIIVSSKVDSTLTLNILNDYNLIFVHKNEWSKYKFKVSSNTPANSLSISNSLYKHSEFNWSTPNGYAYISH